jgi:cytochrome b involved in lipid metabolism
MKGRTFFLVLLPLLILFLFLTGCNQQQTGTGQPQQEQQNKEQNSQASAEQEQPAVKEFTIDEIAKHNLKEDCWLLISGKVYNVTKNVPVHPGGEAILQGCGKDATTLFETRPMGSGTPHSEKARGYLANAYIGDLKQ